MKKQDGYYWVKFMNVWGIALYNSTVDKFFLGKLKLTETRLQAVYDQRILSPDENPVVPVVP
jgi:hypothetical protein